MTKDHLNNPDFKVGNKLLMTADSKVNAYHKGDTMIITKIDDIGVLGNVGQLEGVYLEKNKDYELL